MTLSQKQSAQPAEHIDMLTPGVAPDPYQKTFGMQSGAKIPVHSSIQPILLLTESNAQPTPDLLEQQGAHGAAGTFNTNSTSTNQRKLAVLDGQAGAVATSLCFLPNGEILTGPVDCPGGEAQLLGEYVNVGIHQAGSFGTTAALNATYYTETTSLGLIADYDRNGFATSTPGFSGDYFQYGLAIEGNKLTSHEFTLFKIPFINRMASAL